MMSRLNVHLSYKLSKARAYILKAKRLLAEVELLNSKIAGDFYAIDNFCTMHEIYLRGERERRVDDNDQGRGRQEAESPIFDL